MKTRLFNIKTNRSIDYDLNGDNIDNCIFIIANKEYSYYYVPYKAKIIEIPKNSKLPKGKDELFVTRNKKDELRDKAGFKQIFINLHSECNMECVYCAASESNNLSCSVEVIKASIDYLFEKGYKLQIARFLGSGETLLEFEKFKKIVNYLREYFPDIEIGLVSNATFNKKIAGWLFKNKIKMRLSLDGPPFINDITRSIKNSSKKSTEIIQNTVEFFVNKNAEFTICPTLSKSSIGLESNILYYFWKLGVSLDKAEWNYAICTGRMRKNKELHYFPEDLIESKLRWFELTEIIGGNYLLNKYVNLMDKVFICSNASFSIFSIDDKGNIYGCSKILSSFNEDKLSELKIGKYDFKTKKVEIFDKKVKDVYRLIKTSMKNRGCFSCKHLCLCNGPCYYDELITNQNPKEPNKKIKETCKTNILTNKKILSYFVKRHIWKKYPYYEEKNGKRYFSYVSNKFKIVNSKLPNKDKCAVEVFVDCGSQPDFKKIIQMSNSENYALRLFLIHFENVLENPKQSAIIIQELIENLKDKVCFRIVTSLPYCISKQIEYKIPKSCLECKKMFLVKEGRVIFCGGKKGKLFDEYDNRQEIFNDFKPPGKLNQICKSCVYFIRGKCKGYYCSPQ